VIVRFVRKGARSWNSDNGRDLEGKGEVSYYAMY